MLGSTRRSAGFDPGCRGLESLRGIDRVFSGFAFRSAGGVSGYLGWVIFRIVHFPPFAEFLIATEAEMNKVSWTNKEDLIRATTVVLATVVLMTVFLFMVDTLVDLRAADDWCAPVRRQRRIRVDGLSQE